ncbi:type ISP restriction/modification enzyme [Lysinibacillus capsici]|uniref:type ISP restriction/modification enzyme n=1 Tax=Lysinibacillus capsici TaxID=2115968 RepID=UPI002A811F40|nr:type ISP restriction/modification enzyme [Lysinibacillus capsici]
MDQFVSIVNNLPDNDLSSRGNAYIFPIVFPEQSTSELKGNINDKIIKIVKEFYESETDEKKIANDLILYIYATLSSNTYREYYYEIIYHGLLKGMVRVPLPVEKELYFKLRDLGKELAKAQLLEININLLESTIECEGNINIPVQKIIFSIDENTILFKGYHKQESFKLKNVPSEVYAYSIMGYDVLETYLKYKTYPYINRGLNDVDIKEVIKMIESLVKYMNIIEDIDSVVEGVLATS